MVRILVAAGLLLGAGCGGAGGPVLPVTGTITVRGKPEANLIVQFNPVGGTEEKPYIGTATSDEGGKFTVTGPTGVPGLPAGAYVVTVVDGNPGLEDSELGKGKKAPPIRVARKYTSADDRVNTLKVTVTAGQTTYDLKLD